MIQDTHPRLSDRPNADPLDDLVFGLGLVQCVMRVLG